MINDDPIIGKAHMINQWIYKYLSNIMKEMTCNFKDKIK